MIDLIVHHADVISSKATATGSENTSPPPVRHNKNKQPVALLCLALTAVGEGRKLSRCGGGGIQQLLQQFTVLPAVTCSIRLCHSRNSCGLQLSSAATLVRYSGLWTPVWSCWRLCEVSISGQPLISLPAARAANAASSLTRPGWHQVTKTGLSVRALAARHKVHRRTVRQALESASPPPCKPRQSVAWRLKPFKTVIDAMLTEDTTAPRKQRDTARRILARLIEEYAAEELSYSMVRDYVRVRGAKIEVEAGRG